MKLANITSVYRSELIALSYSDWINKKNLTVLDVGCGTGVVAYQLKKIFSFSELVGCDLENYLIVDIPFKKMATLDKLPFKHKSFDIAMINDVLHHTSYKNQINLTMESSRVATNIFIFELIPTKPGKFFDFLINKIHNPHMNIPYTYRKPEEWEKLFGSLYLKFEKKEVYSPFWYPFKHIAYKVMV